MPILTPGAMNPPGVVIDHVPARAGKYVGSPSIAKLPAGDYLASHDYFTRNLLGAAPQNELLVFGSTDRGQTWRKRSELEGFWQNLFVHRQALYLMGVRREYGHVVIRRSLDGGFTWTEPADKSSGLLLDEAQYHTAPAPMLAHGGRIWRAMEDAEGGADWGKRFRAFMMSAPLDADLLDAASWRLTNRIARDEAWLGGGFGGWLEGNAVLAPDGRVVDILRVDTPGLPEKAAMITVSEDGAHASFDPATGFIDFPGGAKKFTIRYDPQSGCYWALVNPVRPEFAGRKPGEIRNTLALSRSDDLRAWELRAILLEHPDERAHAFQYADWLFDENDLIAVVRTAYDDGEGGASSAHDANYLTFHRFEDFRDL